MVIHSLCSNGSSVIVSHLEESRGEETREDRGPGNGDLGGRKRDGG